MFTFVTPAKAGAQRTQKNWVPAFAGMTMIVLATPAAAQEKQPPYWASIASGQAMTHTGPGRNYPNVWLYQRRDLPVRVVKKYENWRLVQDPDGAQGWMLVSMLADLTAMQLYCMQIGRLAEDGQLTATVAGLAKMHNTRKARLLAAEARDMLGGNGILLDNHVIRHMADLEAIHTFEGTETMQTLIVGRDITGIGAFA